MRKPRKRAFVKGGYSCGRWAVERERCRIDEPVPPIPFDDSHAVAETLGLLIDRLGLDHGGWTAQCEAHWGEIVGGAVGQHTRPGKLLDNKLVVYVDTSVWLSELSRNGKSTILKRLQDRFGAERVGSITLRLDPGRGPDRV